MDSLIQEVNGGEKLYSGGDLNSHVGKENNDYNSVHGVWS